MKSSRHETPDCDVAVVGAGPYGLSATSYLKDMGLNVKVFGEPMAFWDRTMPEGMLLRSPRVASNIDAPNGAHSLDAFEEATRTPAAAPVPLDTFVKYGCWFQQRLGNAWHPQSVSRVDKQGSLFRVTLKDGTTLSCHRVVVAAGVGSFYRKPAIFSQVPGDLATHCYEGRPIKEFVGKRVAVIGAGQSALESAALLHEAGSLVEVIARIPELRWIGGHPWLHRLGPISAMLYSKHDVGPVGISRLVAYPNLVSYIPLSVRDKIGARAVRPAGARWLPARLTNVKIATGRSVISAESCGKEVRLKLDDGTERRVDHVLLGTGYKVDLAKYEFLPETLRREIRQLDGAPELKRGFESSVPGLHFMGAPAARSFGPLLRFVAGTEFASPELRRCLERSGVHV